MAKQNSNNVNDSFQTVDIMRENTYAFDLAKLLSRRPKTGFSRQEVIAKLGGDPSPYIKMYACFVAIKRGQYAYVGNNLADLK